MKVKVPSDRETISTFGKTLNLGIHVHKGIAGLSYSFDDLIWLYDAPGTSNFQIAKLRSLWFFGRIG